MHQAILGAGVRAARAALAALVTLIAWPAAAAAPQPAAAGRACPGAGARVVEQVMPADCEDCWARPPASAALPRGGGWRFDWVAPAASGSEAAMAAAALPESAERAQRLPAAAPGQPLALPGRLASTTLPAPAAVRLRVQSGPAWQGYFGLQVTVRAGRALPAGSSAWLALVEQVPAGSAGSPLARSLLRSVVGPLPLPAPGSAVLVHRHALRWPDAARPERLQARAWVEGPDGQLLAVAADRCDSP